MYILHGVGNNWALWKVQGQSSQLILSPLAGAAHRSERRRPLISPTSSRCSAREREECKWVLSRKPSPAPSTLKSPTLCQAEISCTHGSSLSNFNYWGTRRGKEGESRILTIGVHAESLFFLLFVVSRMNILIGIKMYICHAYRGSWIGLEEALSLCAHGAQGWGCVLMGAPPSFSQIPPLLWLWVNVSSC